MKRTPRRARWSAALFFATGGCGGRDVAPADRPMVADTCRVQLAPRSTSLQPASPTQPPPTPSRSSRLVAHVEMRLAPLVKELEGRVPPRLAEERNKSVGMAGHVNYTVDRGPFSAAIEGDALVIHTDVKSRADVCRGSDCYASCEPQGRATVTVPLRLTPDYRFAPSRVSFAFTRGCEIRALGGLLKIDVTPTIQGQLAPALRRVEQEIDGKLPPLRPQVERLWAEIGKSRELPLGGCVVTNPRGIVEGPVTGSVESLRVRFGLVAYPEIRSRCGDVAPPAALPRLAHDPTMPAEDDLVLALMSPLARTAAALEATGPLDAGGARARIARTSAMASGTFAELDLGLRGEACGDLGVRTMFGWSDDGRSLRLASPTFADGERERAASVALAPDVFIRSLSEVRFPPPIAPETLKDLVPTIASSMSDASLDVSARVSDVKPLDVTLRGDDVSASVLVRGSVELKQR